MRQIILIIGGNIGDRLSLITQAKQLLDEKIGKVSLISSLYETEAWGGVSKGNYLNQILILESELSAEEVLDKALQIEKILGRQRDIKWGNRTMDIDILYYGDQIIDTPNLKIPHPYLHLRRFVLEPLAEIVPDFIHPILKLTSTALLKNCEDDSIVKIIGEKP
ncbi:2-amino-4-hydroxy-6-hydroxymethyldihydropteridine diphosphokinase [Belliella aquatica]|uniref:2-amino-4-hydroxy-6-hydroxymethyldihydropteridine pyrophosphokinase n=1 Tax=Belliella aquatica TaxID=1323734 RepID=A0ABQ1N8B4_9BACT|nr:2-amino-4-hydroxy-6-hydroxymethyldihydropteridine diphosphokinase [Belliella aquatica]MCH7407522.1 2-amino-4-hydroxy-6-hydroxymethyldihydropteridine diphosphokinase [Belliella aquatica]GGC54272.1 2-amino-4-hydroxy-6-hydroxymethyldihydropteridine diphosphokinase [Belliella aquatica]